MTKTQRTLDFLIKNKKITHEDKKKYNLTNISYVISRLRKRGYNIKTVYFGKKQGYILVKNTFWFKILKWLSKKCVK